MQTIWTVLACGVFAGLFGIAVRSIIEHHLRNLIACSVIVVFFVPLLTVSQKSLGLSLGESLSVIGVGVMTTFLFSIWHKKSLRRMVAFAPAVREFGLKNFWWLDRDSNGLIGRLDFSFARDRSKTLSAQDRKMVAYLAWHIDRIGHVTDSFLSVHPMSGSAILVEEHAIGRGDFEGYPQKIRAEYERQYGAL